MTKKILLPLFLCLITSYNLHSQGEPDYREIFLEAESYFLFEEYNESLPLYLRINSKFPENNINYKIGVCYLNNSYEKEKAISYLERAVTDINPEYKENNFKETHSPLDALFNLGNAYRINNQIDKAIETYEKFKEQADPAIYDLKLVDEQIDACNNAIDLKTRPIDIDIVNLGDRINTRFSDIDPVVSGDETKWFTYKNSSFMMRFSFQKKLMEYGHIREI
jgi:tetratricopeptide (TPR) repeat protein